MPKFKQVGLSIFFLGCLTFAVAATFADESAGSLEKSLTVEERLKQLESEVKTLRHENKQLREDMGIKSGGVNVKAAGKEASLLLGGLLQVQSEFGARGDSRFGSDNDRFYLRRARLNASGKFLEEFDFRIEMELAGTLAESSALRAQMTDGYINWNKWDWMNVRMGQFKTPFGYEQLYADPNLFTIERSLANDRLTLGRQIGLQAGGSLFEKNLSYASGIFNGTGVNNNFNDNDDFVFVQRIEGNPWQGKLLNKDASWSIGGNAFYSDDARLTGQPSEFRFDSVPGGAIDNIFAGSRIGIGADTQFHLGPFDLWMEYLRTEFKPKDNFPAKHFDSEGGYIQGAYFIFPKKLQMLVKYETFDPNVQVRGDSTDTWTFGLNYYIKDSSLKIQLAYLLVSPAGFPDDQNKVLLRFQGAF